MEIGGHSFQLFQFHNMREFLQFHNIYFIICIEIGGHSFEFLQGTRTWDLCVCPMRVPYMCALCVCLMSAPYMRALHVPVFVCLSSLS